MADSERTDHLPRVVLSEPDDALVRTLREGQFLLLKYPQAAQAAFRALVAEGRRFAQTPAGRRWRNRLADSELMRRGRILWEESALTMLEDNEETVLPSLLLDALISALASDDLATLLVRLTQEDNQDAGTSDS